jgi:hypothetical protein
VGDERTVNEPEWIRALLGGLVEGHPASPGSAPWPAAS